VHHVSNNFQFVKFSKSITTKSTILYDFSWWSTKRTNRKVKIAFTFDIMDSKIEEALAPFRAKVKEQVSAIWIQIVLKLLLLLLLLSILIS
jgi:DNA repair photolyase